MELSLLKGGVAVLTGSASGMGLSMAIECAKYGMSVMISDVRESAIAPAMAQIQKEQAGAKVSGAVCDVTDAASVDALLASAKKEFPGQPIQFIAANAGVIFPKATVLTATPEEWELTYKVNIIGVANTLRSFVPEMLAQPQQSVVQVTASAAGVSFGAAGPYGTSKLAALGIAEALQRELESIDGATQKLHVVALCPAIVTTGLLDTSTEIEEQKGSGIQGMTANADSAESQRSVDQFRNVWDHGMTPQYAAEQVFEHVKDGKFYCILDNEIDGKPTGLDANITRRYDSFMSRKFIGRPAGSGSSALLALNKQQLVPEKASSKL